MKVKKLIEKLKEYPQDAIVVAPNEGDNEPPSEAEIVDYEKCNLNINKKYVYITGDGSIEAPPDFYL